MRGYIKTFNCLGSANPQHSHTLKCVAQNKYIKYLSIRNLITKKSQ